MNPRLQKHFLEIDILNVLYCLQLTEDLQIIVEVIAVHMPWRLLEKVFLVVHADFHIYIVLNNSSSSRSSRDKGKHTPFFDQILQKEKRDPFP